MNVINIINILKSNYFSFFQSNDINLIPIKLNISLINYCNLNCSDCQAFCSNNNKKDSITLEELQNYIPIIKQYFLIEEIILLGGEPLLHIDLINICKYLRSQFHDLKIKILSNGKNIKKTLLKNYEILKKLNIIFEFSIYPNIDLISNIKEIEKLNIKTEIRNIRPMFSKITFNKQGINNINKFFLCGSVQKYPIELFMNHEKLFKCCLPSNWHHINLPVDEKDYLNIKKLNKKNIINYLSNALPACKYCGSYNSNNKINNLISDSNDFIFWHQQKDISNDYFHNLYWYYLNDYQTYYKYCHDCQHILPLLTDNYFLNKHLDEGYAQNIIKILQIRFFKGEKDIFIPFNKNITNIQITTLKNQLFKMKNFLNINFYFISIDKNTQAKEIMYKNFLPFSNSQYGNFYFLEANNLKEGYNCFLTNSYLNIKEKILYLIQ